MKHAIFALLFSVLAGICRAEDTAQPVALKVPDGYTVELVAGPPLVDRPIMASFDDRGRLFVTDSSGDNLKGADLLKNPPHSIRILEDTDGDGKFDKTTLFADKLVFPQGLLWHDGAVFVISPPSLWKLEDTNGDGVCDKRTELVTGMAVTGVADDAHGACLGPDGRIYFLPGRMNHNLKLPDGTPIRKATGPWIMRCRPDGRDVEIVCGSQGNPVEVDFTPEGDFFASGTFWAPDAFGGGLRDALIHGVEGGEYPVRDRTYNDRKRTGDLLPVLVPMVATAPSGMMLYKETGKDSALGSDCVNNLFCTYFNTHKVQRHVLERDGATWKSLNEEFVSSANTDFHPTDVLEDADGSLLIVDTGGWFRIGCPTSQIAKPQVKGGIYRVRKNGAPKMSDPRGLAADWKNPAKLLDDPRWAVRERALREVAMIGAPTLPALNESLKSDSVTARRNAVWALSRIDGPEARAATRVAFGDKDASVRQVAVNGAGLHRDADALTQLLTISKSDTPPIRRDAATALGRIGKTDAVPALFDSLRGNVDRFLEHALLFALIRIHDRPSSLAALKDPSPAVRRAALIALDQMDGGELSAELVTPLLDPADPSLQQTALNVILAHPAWAKELLGLCGQWLSEENLDAAKQDNLRGILLSFSGDAAVQDIIARALRNEKTPSATRAILLETIARVPLDVLPPTWSAEARWALDSSDEKIVRLAVAALRVKGVADFDAPLLKLARDDARPQELRVEALIAAAPRLAKVDVALFDLLRGNLDKEKAPLLRLAAADALGRLQLNDSQLKSLIAGLGDAGALELPKLLPAFAHSQKEDTGKKLVAALATSPALKSLTGDSLRQTLKGYPDSVRADAAPLLKKLDVDTEEQKARLAELAPVLNGGDAKHGRETFFSKKAICSTCHTIQGTGGRVGPDLSKIGSIRTGADLLEAIAFPSSSFARGFEPYLVKTKDGQAVSGIIARETPDAIFFYGTDRVETRVLRSNLAEMKQSKTSIMPQGLDQVLSRQELADIIAFLTSLK
jgi:putative membrane-bound dehydrogenase-like protein